MNEWPATMGSLKLLPVALSNTLLGVLPLSLAILCVHLKGRARG